MAFCIGLPERQPTLSLRLARFLTAAVRGRPFLDGQATASSEELRTYAAQEETAPK